MKKTLLALGSAAALAAAANADVKFTIDDMIVSGFQGNEIETSLLSGTLTGISFSYDYDGSQSSSSWASDALFSWGNNVQGYSSIGGYNGTIGTWLGNWSYFGPGSAPNGTYGEAISVPALVLNNETLFLGMFNAYSGSGPVAYSNISITLIGVNKVPAPGALALLGAAGLAGSRRRRA